jgi:hypothetical protein
MPARKHRCTQTQKTADQDPAMVRHRSWPLEQASRSSGTNARWRSNNPIFSSRAQLALFPFWNSVDY